MCRYSQIAARAGLTAGPGAKGGDAAVTSEDRMLMEEERGEELDLKAKMEASLRAARMRSIRTRSSTARTTTGTRRCFWQRSRVIRNSLRH